MIISFNYKEINLNNDFNLKELINKIDESIENISIINGNDIKLYIDNELFIFKDKIMFNNIYLPEIIKKYLKYNNLESNIKEHQFNSYFLIINGNFSLINFSEDEVNSYIIYLKELNKNNNINRELKENYTFIKDIEPVKPSYSYGYVSIIFISLIMSIITILIAIMHL